MILKKHFFILCIFFCILFFSGCAVEEETYSKDEVDDKINELNEDAVKIIGWGLIYANGIDFKGSGNYTCAKTATGNYTITWNNGILTPYDDYIFSAIPYTTAQNIVVTYATGNGGANVYFRLFNTTSGAATDCAFNFFVMSKK